MASRRASTKGFTRTSNLLTERIRKASETRGFGQSRLLTQWAEIAGEATASISRPVEVSYRRGGMGATLTLLTTGANAPMLEMQKEQLRDKVNKVYGYNAIARVRITQTAATGFAEGQVAFQPEKPATKTNETSPEIQKQAQRTADGIGDSGLRDALTLLAENVLKKNKQ